MACTLSRRRVRLASRGSCGRRISCGSRRRLGRDRPERCCRRSCATKVVTAAIFSSVSIASCGGMMLLYGLPSMVIGPDVALENHGDEALGGAIDIGRLGQRREDHRQAERRSAGGRRSRSSCTRSCRRRAARAWRRRAPGGPGWRAPARTRTARSESGSVHAGVGVEEDARRLTPSRRRARLGSRGFCGRRISCARRRRCSFVTAAALLPKLART